MTRGCAVREGVWVRLRAPQATEGASSRRQVRAEGRSDPAVGRLEGGRGRAGSQLGGTAGDR